MQPFSAHQGIVLPLDREDLDTDQILPGEFMKLIERTGFSPYLFHELRYLPDGSPDPGFVLNHPSYQGAAILVTGRNCGCGSSRETAVYALRDYGFRVIIAPSFADIFAGNCFENGLLLIALPQGDVRYLIDEAVSRPGYRLHVDLERCVVWDGEGFRRSFQVDPYRRECLLKGLDGVAMTLQRDGEIRYYEAQVPPWRTVRAP
jgi:3-isopropylmalate/(R)-2-methylmalate dehydratase small subunit